MIDLFYAIYIKYQGSPLASELTGFYNTQADENAVYPYGVFQLISNVPDWTFTEEMENCLIQINLFSDTVNAEEICSLYEMLKTTFDFLDLDIVNYGMISNVRENAILIRVEKVWQYNVMYRILLGKS